MVDVAILLYARPPEAGFIGVCSPFTAGRWQQLGLILSGDRKGMGKAPVKRGESAGDRCRKRAIRGPDQGRRIMPTAAGPGSPCGAPHLGNTLQLFFILGIVFVVLG